MNSPLIFAMPGNIAMARSLAAGCQGEIGELETRNFPDGETYLRYRTDPAARRVIIVSTLAHPNQQFLPLSFAAATARDLGAGQVGLVAPYLCYMRQDCQFHRGEAVTSRQFAALISRDFDWLVTVDPHLHRYKALNDLYSIPSRVVHAGGAIADWIKTHVKRPFIIGPDCESAQWVTEVARVCGARFSILHKDRMSDRDVRIRPEELTQIGSATPILLDDIISTGTTILGALAAIRPFTQEQPIVIGVHGIFADASDARITAHGAHLVTTNTIPNCANRIDISTHIASPVMGLLKEYGASLKRTVT